MSTQGTVGRGLTPSGRWFPVLVPLAIGLVAAGAYWSGRQLPDPTPVQTSCVVYQQANAEAQDDLDRAQMAIGGLDPAKPGSQEIAAASEALRRATGRRC